ncbi:hypothetical protein Pfo_001622 [Paulownia fortunei]|nr:hypothetical protein Pfo_001622 [Paulownia fortunei]
MALFASFFSCFNVVSSSRVSDASGRHSKSSSSKKSKNKEKSPRAPIPMSYFPINSQISRL